MWSSNLENDCIALLTHVVEHPGEYQTYKSLSEGTNIPVGTLYGIITAYRTYGPNNWALGTYADKYGFLVSFVGRPGEIVYVCRKL